MPARARKSRRITSGDDTVDWIFSRIIHALNYEIEVIMLKRFLREKYRGKMKNFYGYIEDDVISLSNSKTWHPNRRAIAKTLLHEVMHFVFGSIHERDIRRLEDLVWEKLSEEQMRILKSFVPKHVVKNSYTA